MFPLKPIQVNKLIIKTNSSKQINNAKIELKLWHQQKQPFRRV